MASSRYLDVVRQYLQSDGWEIGSTQLQQGVFLVRGRQQSAGGEQSIVTMVITAEAGQATPNHLKYLLQTGREEGADLSLLAAEQPTSDELHAAAADNGVHVLGDEELDNQAATGSTAMGESAAGSPADAVSGSVSSTDNRHSFDSDSTDDPPFPDPWRVLKAYFAAKLSRRRLIAGSAVLVGGTAAGGYGLYRSPSALSIEDETDTEEQTDTDEVAYADLRENTDRYLETTVYYGPAHIAQRIDTDSGTRLRLQVTRVDQDVWRNDIMGQWDGEPFSTGEIVEFRGVVIGTVTYETVLGIERTVPEVEIVEIATVEG